MIFPYLIQHFAVIREILGSLIGTRSITMVFWHEGANEGGEFIDASLVFDAVIGGYFHNKTRWIEGDLFANLDPTHGEFKAGTFHFSLL